jgi:hypothetical protein
MNEKTGIFANVCIRCVSAAYVALAVITAGTLVWVMLIH